MSNVYCSVFNCKSMEKKHPSISFHNFPKIGESIVNYENKYGLIEKIDRQKVWILKLKIGKPVSKYMKVCSLHFTDSDFIYKTNPNKRNFLKKIAAPSLNLPLHTSTSFSSSSTRSKRLLARNLKKTDHVEVSDQDKLILEETENECTNFETNFDDELLAAHGLLELQNTVTSTKNEKLVRHVGVQVNTYRNSTVCDLMKDDDSLNTFTGLNSFKLLNVIVTLVEYIYKDTRSHILNIKERIILTFTKLKTDMTFKILSKLFNISPTLCATYFQEMLPILSNALENGVHFPTKDEVLRNIPKYFKYFGDTRIVLDCTEVFVQSPRCLCCRVRFYSHYKGHIPVKFMTGVSPAGMITFVGEPYGGRASDKTIFENSGLLNLLEDCDAVMVDKGFLIDDECAQHNLKIYRPPFLKGKNQLSEEEAKYNAKIAAARVHIERCNQRIKQFKILSGKLQWSFVLYIKSIFNIICAITNLSNPILSLNKFM